MTQIKHQVVVIPVDDLPGIGPGGYQQLQLFQRGFGRLPGEVAAVCQRIKIAADQRFSPVSLIDIRAPVDREDKFCEARLFTELF